MKPMDYFLVAIWLLVVLGMAAQFILIPKKLRPYARFTFTPFGAISFYGIPVVVLYRLFG
jgi:hypothetical protein